MQEQDFNWFLNNYDDLFKKYGVSFLAIKEEKVIGKYDSYTEAVHETMKFEPIGSFIVQKCDGSEAAFTNYIATVYLS